MEQKDINAITDGVKSIQDEALITKSTLTTQAQKIEDLKEAIADLEAKGQRPNIEEKDTAEMNHSARNQLVKAWLKDGEKDLGVFASKAAQLDTVTPANGGIAIEEELGKEIIELSREAFPILSEVGSLSVGSKDYRQPVLIGLPQVLGTTENVAGTQPAETTVETYTEITGKFIKAYSQPRFTNEVAMDPHIDIVAHMRSLLVEMESRYMVNQVLFGDGSSTGMRGILTKRCDSTNAFAESLKGDIARDPDFYKVLKSGNASLIGADSTDIIENLIDMTIDLPTAYVSGSKFIMNRRTFATLRKVVDTAGRPLLTSTQDRGYVGASGFDIIGFPVLIDDNMPDVAADSTPIIFGNLAQAFRLLPVAGSDFMVQDQITKKGNTILYHEWWVGDVIYHNDAIRVMAIAA